MSVETNVFDFDKDVYGNRVEVALIILKAGNEV